MPSTIIGRKSELQTLAKVLASLEAELVAVTGRRRIGKIFLVTSAYEEHFIFDIMGVQNGSLETQLQNFADQLALYTQSDFPLKTPLSWAEAFRLLRNYIQNKASNSKKVLFFDELPWLAGQKSGFLEAFGYFWNSWASRQNLVIVICGSAASWMIQQVVNDKGGLHNRITKHIYLEPFTLAETQSYLQYRQIFLAPYQVVQIYMVLGGVPHYLKELDPEKTTIQNIDSLCFSKKGALSDEFNRLYPSLFANADNHITVVRTLALKNQGMTRNELVDISKLPNGGGLSKILEELGQSGFITEYFPFGKKKKEKIYRLSDEYSLFYLQFIERHRYQSGTIWQTLSQTPAYQSWAGYAFEGLCLKHLEQIKQALGISGVYALASSFYKKGDSQNDGLQIDMVLDRNDHIINLFEIKFYNKHFSLTKKYADDLQQKLWLFQENTKTTKQVNWVFITTFGLTPNQYSSGLVDKALTMNDLFLF
jgi:uncharacterized protein